MNRYKNEFWPAGRLTDATVQVIMWRDDGDVVTRSCTFGPKRTITEALLIAYRLLREAP